MRKASLVGALLAFALAWTAPVAAQELRGSIEGTVKDTSGGVLPGVTVEAKHLATNSTQMAVTDASGMYRFPSLITGKYVVTATLSGFNSSKMENVEINLGLHLKVDLAMSISGVAETVQVTGESPIVDVKQNSVTATISSSTARRSGPPARTTPTGCSCSRGRTRMRRSTAASPTS